MARLTRRQKAAREREAKKREARAKMNEAISELSDSVSDTVRMPRKARESVESIIEEPIEPTEIVSQVHNETIPPQIILDLMEGQEIDLYIEQGRPCVISEVHCDIQYNELGVLFEFEYLYDTAKTVHLHNGQEIYAICSNSYIPDISASVIKEALKLKGIETEEIGILRTGKRVKYKGGTATYPRVVIQYDESVPVLVYQFNEGILLNAEFNDGTFASFALSQFRLKDPHFFGVLMISDTSLPTDKSDTEARDKFIKDYFDPIRYSLCKLSYLLLTKKKDKPPISPMNFRTENEKTAVSIRRERPMRNKRQDNPVRDKFMI
jgi:hypothetical protein